MKYQTAREMCIRDRKEGDIIVAEGVGLLREGTPIKVKQN